MPRISFTLQGCVLPPGSVASGMAGTALPTMLSDRRKRPHVELVFRMPVMPRQRRVELHTWLRGISMAVKLALNLNAHVKGPIVMVEGKRCVEYASAQCLVIGITLVKLHCSVRYAKCGEVGNRRPIKTPAEAL